jgi:hypothetical protein
MFEAFSGSMVRVYGLVSPIFIVISVGEIVTPVTGTIALLTVTDALETIPPSDVVTMILAFPSDFPTTRPLESTLATEGSLEDHETSWLVAFSGERRYEN